MRRSFPLLPSGPSLGGEQNELQDARLSEFVSRTLFDGTRLWTQSLVALRTPAICFRRIA